ncbi:MAG TPA: coniferyl aldehyde dehydrogenase [Candidatus Binataceae bacterium]|nr:coniferyl aldehyde dehydrogenase [Candidatus Binataceae bacterium]
MSTAISTPQRLQPITGGNDPSAGSGQALSAILRRQRDAFLKDGPPSLEARRDALAKLKKVIQGNVQKIAAVISSDFGNRSAEETMFAEIWTTLSGIRHARSHLRKWMKPKRVGVALELMPGRAYIQYQPLGVVGIISPWNYPIQLSMLPLMAAIAAGNRVMLKPSELTPNTSALLAELLGSVFPAEQVAVVQGGPEVGEAFSRLPFDHLLYTGSTSIGRQVMRAAAENLTPVTLELGGKSPCIVAEDTPLSSAAESIAFGKLLNAGQTCIAPDYAMVPAARRDEFVRAIEATVRKFYPNLKSNPDYTSIVNDRHYRRLSGYIEEAKSKGAQVIEINPAGESLETSARKIVPTLVIDPADDLSVMCEEIFGPILPIKTYHRLDEVVDFINRRPRPLALYYFGVDPKPREEVLQRTISGGVSVNETLMHCVAENLPFGGVGASGIGAYHGETGFQTFSHRKGVFVQSRFNSGALMHPPFGRIAKTMLKFLLMR